MRLPVLRLLTLVSNALSPVSVVLRLIPLGKKVFIIYWAGRLMEPERHALRLNTLINKNMLKKPQK